MNAALRLISVGAGSHVALECGDRRLDYDALRDAVPRAGGAWRALGLEPGSRVIVYAPDSIEWVVAYLGVLWAGGVAIGVNPRLGLPELSSIVRDSEVRYLWCEAGVAVALRALAETAPAQPLVVSNGDGGHADWEDALSTAPTIGAAPRDEDDPALWIGTSGTTGTPKGVIHTQRVAGNPHSFAEIVLRATSEDRFYATSKLFFAYALANSLFAGLRLGATVILDRESPTPARVDEMVRRYRPTILFTVPTLYSKILAERLARRLGESGIRHFVSAGEAMPGALRRAWLAAAGKPPISGYGTSETLTLVMYADDESGLLRPTPCASLRYAEGIDPVVPQRIWVRNPTLAVGYWRHPEAQADGFRDGWFSPGDMFLRRPEDRLEYAGRNDDLLKISGQWVSTLWIEQALAEAAGAAAGQIAAVGVPTAEGLMRIAILAVAAPGREEEARQRIEAGVGNLPKHRRPCWVHWVKELPLTATGKVQRSRLRDVHELALARQ